MKQGIKNPMALMGDLKNGKEINLPDGSVIKPSDVVGPPKLGRKLVILGDTSNSESLVQESQNCDVVVHEATNAKVADEEKSEEDVERDAISHGHSTPQMAGAFAKAVNAKLLLLNHFSSRYKGDQDPESIVVMKQIEELAKITFNHDNVIAAYD
jgi:ribonuclease Z